MDSPQPFGLKHWLVGAVLAVLTFAAFLPVLRCDLNYFDDDQYVTGNRYVLHGLTAADFRWAWRGDTPGYWQPLSWLSLMADSTLSGTSPLSYHRTNLIIHSISAAVVFWVLCQLTGTFWRAALVAALYAVHPLRVESVAWVAERKDVLSNLMAWLAIGGYVFYAKAPSAKRYLCVLIPFVLGLLAKPMIVTVPCLLMLLDYWPLRRMQTQPWRRLVAEKAPLFLLALAAAGATLVAQRRCQAMVTLAMYPLHFRLATAALGYVLYLKKMVWFADLAVFYPLPLLWPPLLWIEAGAAAALLAGITTVVFIMRKQRPWLLVGWLWFLGVMAPVCGIFQAGVQLLADRFSYLPSVGLLLMLVWSIPTVVSRRLAALAATATVAVLCMVTWAQCGYWVNDRMLFQHALDVTSHNWMARGQLGLCDFREGNFHGAKRNLTLALRGNPYDPIANYNLGATLSKLGHEDQAVPYYLAALQIRGNFPDAFNNLGVIAQHQRNLKQAYEMYKKALDCDPDFEPALSNLGGLLTQIGMASLGEKELRHAVALNPKDEIAQSKLAAAITIERMQANGKSPTAAADTGTR